MLFFESCAVEYGGKVDVRHMNEDDFKIAEAWNKTGYIKFGRICAKDIISGIRASTHWVELSDTAWTEAHVERKERFNRIDSKRTWTRTEELR